MSDESKYYDYPILIEDAIIDNREISPVDLYFSKKKEWEKPMRIHENAQRNQKEKIALLVREKRVVDVTIDASKTLGIVAIEVINLAASFSVFLLRFMQCVFNGMGREISARNRRANLRHRRESFTRDTNSDQHRNINVNVNINVNQ